MSSHKKINLLFGRFFRYVFFLCLRRLSVGKRPTTPIGKEGFYEIRYQSPLRLRRIRKRHIIICQIRPCYVRRTDDSEKSVGKRPRCTAPRDDIFFNGPHKWGLTRDVAGGLPPGHEGCMCLDHGQTLREIPRCAFRIVQRESVRMVHKSKHVSMWKK